MKKREFWKVCKKLANEERIDVLRKVMASPDKDGLPVGQIADAVRIGQPATSIYLAQLQDACGLVACTRQGRYCLYRAIPDPSDAKMVALFRPLKKYFIEETPDWKSANGVRPPAPPFLTVLPALANAMRVRLLGFVRAEKQTTRERIVKKTGMSDINVRRHLSCLVSCGLAREDDDTIVWCEPDNALSRLFIDLSLS